VWKALGSKLGKGEKLLSGDYKGATQGIRPWASEIVMDEICNMVGAPVDIKELAIRALTQHIFHFKNKGDDIYSPQKQGQLMGSIMSFFVLCIINAAVSRLSYEIANKARCNLRQWPGLVNGDDIGMKGPHNISDVWEAVIRSVGFKKSIGKCYDSPYFITLNSRLFIRGDPYRIEESELLEDGTVVTKYRSGCNFTEVKFINSRLMMGRARSTVMSGPDAQSLDLGGENDIAERAWALKENSPPDLWSVIYGRFLNTHREMLKNTGLPWTMPKWLGGLGLPLMPGEKYSRTDLSIAHRIIRNWDRSVKREGGKESFLFRPRLVSTSTSTTYGARAIALRALPEGNLVWTSDRDHVSVKNLQHYTDLAVQDLLSNMNVQFEDLEKTPLGTDAIKSALNHNRRIWSPKYQPKVSIPAPIDPRFVNLETYYPGLAYDIGQIPPSDVTVTHLNTLNAAYKDRHEVLAQAHLD
jgi:hypothetical protein